MDRLAARAAAQRAEVFGRPAVYAGTPIVIVLTAVVSRKQLLDGGFEAEHDALGRVARNGVTYTVGSKLTYNGTEYRIDEVRTHPVNPEIVLGLKQL